MKQIQKFVIRSEHEWKSIASNPGIKLKFPRDVAIAATNRT